MLNGRSANAIATTLAPNAVELVWRHINSHLNALNAGDTRFCRMLYVLVPHAMMNLHDTFANRSDFLTAPLRSVSVNVYVSFHLFIFALRTVEEREKQNHNKACVVPSCLFCSFASFFVVSAA